MVTCGNCGSGVPDEAGTCPECGADLPGGAPGDPPETAPGGDGDETSSSTGRGEDRVISSEEAESGTTRIYGLSGAEGASGEASPDPEPSGAAPVESSTTKVSPTDEQAAVGPEASDPPPGSRPTSESSEDSDGGYRRRILAGIGLLALGAGGWYAVLGRDGGGGGSGDGENTGDTDGTTDGGSGSDDQDSDGSGAGSETDGSDGDDSASGDMLEIEMGILMGVSGGLEELGPPIRDGAELVVRQINEGSTDISVDTGFEDTGTSSSQGVEGAQALVDAGYPMICGALASDVSLAVAESVAIPAEIPMNSPSSTVPQYTGLDGDFTFRTAVPDSIQGQVLADIARERLGADTAATLAHDDSYGRALSAEFVESFESAGGTITDEVIFARGQNSYLSQLRTALDGEPDLLVVVTFPPDGVQIFQDFYAEFDREGMPILVADGLRDDTLQENVGHELTNVTGTFPIGKGPGLAFFRERYEAAYGVDPTTKSFASHAYDAAATLVLAQAAAGESDGTAIRDEIRPVTDEGGTEVTPETIVEGVELAASGEEIEYRGASGEIQYDERGDQTAVAVEYFGFDTDGDIERLDTIELG